MIEIIISIGIIGFGIYFLFLSINKKRYSVLVEEYSEEHAKKAVKKMKLCSYIALASGLLILGLKIVS